MRQRTKRSYVVSEKEALPKIVLAAEEITRLQHGLTILRETPSKTLSTPAHAWEKTLRRRVQKTIQNIHQSTIGG